MLGLTPFNRSSVQKRNTGDFVDFYNMIEDFFNDGFITGRSWRSDTFKIDVKESDNAYEIEAELPGVKREEIKLDYHDGNLMISICRDEQINEEKGNYIHKERRTSSMQRSLYLKNIKPEAIEAKLEEGILKITAPKLEIPDNRLQIEIK